ncbi:hypothetical protein [Massilimicrobiota sp. An142]|uniref:hypothetical protein n=1 Tax=Massilimicrobiota sp. An142 TaxID=1965564 RepID=UPI001302A75E|nr:hypothetical protein [Massilimicrobiota sp. An142]
MKYEIVKIECYSFRDMMDIYEMKYKNDYKLIGYEFNSIYHVGELVLYPRKVKKG